MSTPIPPKSDCRVRNVLFVMADQLRWDYLSCTGHPHLQTRNLDALAARGFALQTHSCRARCAARRACRPTPGATSVATARRGTSCRCRWGRRRWATTCDPTVCAAPSWARPMSRPMSRARDAWAWTPARALACWPWKVASSPGSVMMASGRRASRSRATATATGCGRRAMAATTRGMTTPTLRWGCR